jgi:hypothetical protein
MKAALGFLVGLVVFCGPPFTSHAEPIKMRKSIAQTPTTSIAESTDLKVPPCEIVWTATGEPYHTTALKR